MHDDVTPIIYVFLREVGGKTQFEMLGKVWLGKGPSGQNFQKIRHEH